MSVNKNAVTVTENKKTLNISRFYDLGLVNSAFITVGETNLLDFLFIRTHCINCHGMGTQCKGHVNTWCEC